MKIRAKPSPPHPRSARASRVDRPRAVIAIGLAAALIVAPGPVAALERGQTPLEVEVSPTTTVSGGQVLISGRSVPLGDKKLIPIRVVGPDGAQTELSAGLSADQSFSLPFSQTAAIGEYRVTVFTADRRASMEDGFSVQAGSGIRREATTRMTYAFQAMEEEADTFSQTIREAPASAARDELGERVDGLKQLLADVDKALDLLDRSVEELERAIDKDEEEDEDEDRHGSSGAAPGDKPASSPEPSGDGVGEPKPGADPDYEPGDKPQSVPEPSSDGVGEPKPGADPDYESRDKPQSVPEPSSDGVGEPKPGADPDYEPGDKPQSVPGPSSGDGAGDPGPGETPEPPTVEGEKLKPGGEKPPTVEGEKLKPGGEKPPTGDGEKLKPGGEKPPTGEGEKLKPGGEEPPTGDGEKLKPDGEKPPTGDGEKLKPAGEKPPDGDGEKLEPEGEKPPDGDGKPDPGGEASEESRRQARETLADLHEQMARAADDVEKQEQSFAQQMEKFDYDHTLCDGLHYVQQAWASMTAALTLTKNLAKAAAGGAREIAEKFAAEKAIGFGVGSAGGDSPEGDYTRDQLIANAANHATGSLSHFEFLESGVGGLMDYGLERLFRLSCEKYVGPFKGKMTAEVFVEGGRFYAYETEIEGELRLRYERGSGDQQPVTGEFEGVATGFKLDEDLWRVQPAIKNDVLLRWVIHPLPSVFVESAGLFARAALSPNYFYVPVKGIIEGDAVKISLDAARTDFEKSSTAVYVLVNLSVPFPHVMTQDLPHEGGHYILTRALREDPEFDVVVHREEEYSEVQRSFQHDASTPDNMIKVRTEVEVRACNPKCPG